MFPAVALTHVTVNFFVGDLTEPPATLPREYLSSLYLKGAAMGRGKRVNSILS